MFKNSSQSRRRFLYIGLSSLAGATALAVVKNSNPMYLSHALDNPKRDFQVAGLASLSKRAAAKGLIYGVACGRDVLASDKNLQASIVRQCGVLTPENELKWQFVRPRPDVFDFSRADWIAGFARTHNMLFRGHALVWHEQLPEWFKEVVNRQNAEKFLVEHITTVTKHYAGKIHSWDVVNEAIKPDDGLKSGLRQTPWLKFLGPDYIELAYRVAAQADPKAMLVYNENGLEHNAPEYEVKRTAVLKLLERLKSRGTPIHALGIQSHLLGDASLNPKKLRNFLSNVASLGLKIIISELDVTDQKLPSDTVVRDRIVAAKYEDYLSVVLDERAVIAVLTWGLSDKYSWLSKFGSRSDGAPVRPLPLDLNFKSKLAWNGIARAFDKAPKR
ncbi:endo-1,4-beta-xylanase [Brasilonema bromeliae]|uniref:Beta-xylanase n=1 Tax=Brasilonema bromeliae SPC951 TaxID=385972 RepID=A0ABX1P1U5_9CYAN|nr:glycosyl hydrolase family 10 [Brasilonema bromeliae SPC951]